MDNIVAPSNERRCEELADENPRVGRNCSIGCNQPSGTVANWLVLFVVRPAAGTGGEFGHGEENDLDSRD